MNTGAEIGRGQKDGEKNNNVVESGEGVVSPASIIPNVHGSSSRELFVSIHFTLWHRGL